MVLGGDLFPVRGEELRAWLRTSGQGIFQTFQTGVETLEWMRSEGMAIRTQDFYEIRRSVLEQQANAALILEMPVGDVVPAAWHNDDHGWKLSSPFLYVVRVDGVDPNTYELVSQYVSIASDNQLSASDILDAAGSMTLGQEEWYGVLAEQFTIEKALAMPGAFEYS